MSRKQTHAKSRTSSSYTPEALAFLEGLDVPAQALLLELAGGFQRTPEPAPVDHLMTAAQLAVHKRRYDRVVQIEQQDEREALQREIDALRFPTLEERVGSARRALLLIHAALSCDQNAREEEAIDAAARLARDAADELFWIERQPAELLSQPVPDSDGARELEQLREQLATLEAQTDAAGADARGAR
ncbi:MAG: hypothetical protein AB7N90_12605 [Vicinamibacterales bacterium]